MRTLPLLLALLLAGCGGSSHSVAGKGQGRAVLRVLWPERGRLIPNAANSLVVTISKDVRTLERRVVARPTSGSNQTDTTFDKLPAGALRVDVSAYPDSSGSGTAQATGVGTLNTAVGQVASVTVSLNSTAVSLAVTPASPSLAPGATVVLSASARDAAGNIVLLAAGGGEESLVWISSATGVASVAGTGTSATATGVSLGSTLLTAHLKVSDGGAEVVGKANLVVTPDGTNVPPWPNGFGNAQNTSLGLGPRPVHSQSALVYPGVTLGGGVMGADGTIYDGGTDHDVLAIDTRANARLWRYDAGSFPSSPTLAPNGLLYFTTSAGALVALESATGGVRWRDSGQYRSSVVVGSDGTVYVASELGFSAVDGETGAVRWRTSGTETYTYAPALGHDGTIYVGNDAGSLAAIDSGSGAMKWSRNLNGDLIRAVVVGADGTVYASALNGKLTALNGATGTVRWVSAVSAGQAKPCIGPHGDIYVASVDSVLHAVDPQQGLEEWSLALGDYAPRDPVATSDGLIVVGTPNHLLAVDANTHGFAWQIPIGVDNIPLVTKDGAIYYQGNGDLNVIR